MKEIKQEITIERIMSEEVAGRKALEFLAQTDEYVFHGSWKKLDELKPQQPYSHKKPDGEPSVCASGNYEISIFKSLVNTPACDTKKGVSGWSTDKNGNGLTFSATTEAMKCAEAENSIGYVHVFKKSDFERYRGMEYRTNKNIKPLFIIGVKKVDLPNNIKII